MVRDVNLLAYLPPYVQEYLEIREIMNAENPEFQLIADESEAIKNNQFIESCNLTGISKFEKLIGISPSGDDTLQSRIARVMTRWNDMVPYTFKVLLQKLNTLCGAGNYEITRKLDEHKIIITTHLDLISQAEELDYLLSYMLPANLVLQSNNEMIIKVSGPANIATGFVNCETIELSDSVKNDFNIIPGALFTAGGIVEGQMITLSDSIRKGMSIDSKASFVGGIIDSIVIEISDRN